MYLQQQQNKQKRGWGEIRVFAEILLRCNNQGLVLLEPARWREMYRSNFRGFKKEELLDTSFILVRYERGLCYRYDILKKRTN